MTKPVMNITKAKRALDLRLIVATRKFDVLKTNMF